VAEIEADDDAVEKLGWVRDMYAWSFAAARTHVRHQLLEPPRNPLMVQPPSDTCVACAAMPAATRRVCAFVCLCACACILTLTRLLLACSELGDAALLHYTWGPVIYNASGALVWEARAQRSRRTHASIAPTAR
jgi:hypothetical protein